MKSLRYASRQPESPHIMCVARIRCVDSGSRELTITQLARSSFTCCIRKPLGKYLTAFGYCAEGSYGILRHAAQGCAAKLKLSRLSLTHRKPMRRIRRASLGRIAAAYPVGVRERSASLASAFFFLCLLC